MKSENYSLMNLEKLNIQEEMNYSCDTMLHIYPTANMDYSVLTDREKSILDKVITKFSAYRAKDIVEFHELCGVCQNFLVIEEVTAV